MKIFNTSFASKKQTHIVNGKTIKLEFDSKDRLVAWSRIGNGEKTSAKIKYSQITDWDLRDSLIQTNNKIIRQTVTKDRYSKAYGFKRTVLETDVGFWQSITKKPLGINFISSVIPFDSIKKVAKSMIKSL